MLVKRPLPGLSSDNFGGPPDIFTDANAADFKKGKNTLSIFLIDFGVVLGIDYKATLTDSS